MAQGPDAEDHAQEHAPFGPDGAPGDAGSADPDLDPSRLVLVVVGSSLSAEVADRPIAYLLRARMLDWLEDRFGVGAAPCDVVVCSDLWRLNDRRLQEAPSVSVGGPSVNAMTASLLDEVPGAFVIDGVLSVQLDPAFDERLALVWGVDQSSTMRGADAFCERWLAGFLDHATRAWVGGL